MGELQTFCPYADTSDILFPNRSSCVLIVAPLYIDCGAIALWNTYLVNYTALFVYMFLIMYDGTLDWFSLLLSHATSIQREDAGVQQAIICKTGDQTTNKGGDDEDPKVEP